MAHTREEDQICLPGVVHRRIFRLLRFRAGLQIRGRGFDPSVVGHEFGCFRNSILAVLGSLRRGCNSMHGASPQVNEEIFSRDKHVRKFYSFYNDTPQTINS